MGTILKRASRRRLLREVHLLEEGLEAGVGAEGIEEWVPIEMGHEAVAFFHSSPSSATFRASTTASAILSWISKMSSICRS